MSPKRFVKASDTKVPVANSKGELERILKRYGASGFGTSEDYAKGVATVFFRVPDHLGKDAVQVPVRLEVDVNAVRAALYGPLRTGQKWTQNGLAQGERVAWRHLVLWVDAALSAASAGVQKISEAFLAHTMIQHSDGRILRVVDAMDADAPNHNWRALLPPPGKDQ